MSIDEGKETFHEYQVMKKLTSLFSKKGEEVEEEGRIGRRVLKRVGGWRRKPNNTGIALRAFFR